MLQPSVRSSTPSSSSEEPAPRGVVSTFVSSALLRARRGLASNAVSWVCPLLALALTLPALGIGLQTDDHVLAYEARYRARGPQLFAAEPSQIAASRLDGRFAWWSSPRLAMNFVRPLSALSHALDYRVWPDQPWLMHLENGLLYALLVWIAVRLYRRLLPDPWVSGLAALLFALDDAHGSALGWISTRNGLLSSVFGLLALLAHVRARRERSRALLSASALCTALALLSAEAGVMALAYLVAYACVFESGSLRGRVGSLWPQLGVFGVWAAVYVALGGGLRGSSWYRELGAPLELLVNGVLDLPIWLTSLFGTGPVALALVIPDATPRLWCLLPALLVLTPLYFATPRTREMRFFALGALLCLPPLFTTMPQDRVLLGATFGALGVIAGFLQATADTPSVWLRWARRGFVLFHVVLAPLGLLMTLNSNAQIEHGAQALVDVIPRPLPHQVVLVNSPIELISLYASAKLHRPGDAELRSLHQLYAGNSVLQLSRPDAYTLELYAPRGYGRDTFERVFCKVTDLPRLGEERALVDMHVSVRESDAAGRPTRVQFRFPTPLEAPERAWFAWQGTRPQRWVPPAIDEAVELGPLSILSSLEP